MHILIVAVVSLLAANLASFQAPTAVDIPSWVTFPETVGSFKRVSSSDLVQYGIIARYTREADVSDVFLYRIPRVDGAVVSLKEEADLAQETLLKLEGQRYDRVELVNASLPLGETIGKEHLEGIIVGAMVLIEGRRAATYTTLLNVRGYRLKIRTTIYERKPDVDAVLALVRDLLRTMLAKPV